MERPDDSQGAVTGAPKVESLLLKLMSSIVLFRELEREDLAELLRGASKATFAPGDMVFEEGSSGNSMYVVVQGKFEVFKQVDKSEAHVAFVLPGEHFGEMALIANRHRMASVRAAEKSVALRLTEGAIFAQAKVAVSLLKNMAWLMAEHLSEMNSEVLLLDASRRHGNKAHVPVAEPAAEANGGHSASRMAG